MRALRRRRRYDASLIVDEPQKPRGRMHVQAPSARPMASLSRNRYRVPQTPDGAHGPVRAREHRQASVELDIDSAKVTPLVELKALEHASSLAASAARRQSETHRTADGGARLASVVKVAHNRSLCDRRRERARAATRTRHRTRHRRWRTPPR